MPILSDGLTVLVTIGKRTSLPWLVWLVLLQISPLLTQNFPPFRPHKKVGVIQRNELRASYLNSHILLPEMEKKVYLFEGKPKNYSFSFKPGGQLTFVVTPCASEIKWSIWLRREVGRDYKIHRQRIPRKNQEMLRQFQNDSRQTFHYLQAPPGLYKIRIESLHSDSYVNILATRNNTLPGLYPELPEDKKVYTRLQKRKLTVSWLPPPNVNELIPPVKYCLSISQIKNFKTHCNALAYKNGDKRPKYTSWGLSEEKRINNELRKMAKPIKRVKKKLMFYQCIVGKTSFTYKKLKRGKKYFVDVFIVRKNGKGSSAYIGTTVERKKKKKRRKQKRNFASLTMGKTRTVNLKHTDGVRLNLNSSLSHLVLEAVPCGAKLPFVVFYEKKKLFPTTGVEHWKRMPLSPAKAGTYYMAFPVRRKKSSFVTVSASSNPRSRMVLPKSLDVTVHKALTTCSNVTLQWTESRARQSYCLYRQPLSGPSKVKRSRRQRCLAPSERPKKEKVFCTRKRPDKSSRRRIFTVTDLAPSTLYRFDLFVGNRKSAMVPYESVKETTTSLC